MKPAMYLFVNKGLGMSPGKIAAQAGHAAVEAALLSHPAVAAHSDQYGNVVNYSLDRQNALWDAWRTGLHYAKYVMAARDSEHLSMIERYLRDRGFRTALVIDEGHTEIEPIQATALGVALVDKDDPHAEATFSSFKLFRQPAFAVIECTDRMSRDTYLRIKEAAQTGDFERARGIAKAAERPKGRGWFHRG